MQLTSKQIKYLKGLAHQLAAYVYVGDKGVSEPVIEKLDAELEIHELVKVKVAMDDREARKAAILLLAEKTNSAHVQSIGKVGVFYRRRTKEPEIKLPKA